MSAPEATVTQPTAFDKIIQHQDLFVGDAAEACHGLIDGYMAVRDISGNQKADGGLLYAIADHLDISVGPLLASAEAHPSMICPTSGYVCPFSGEVEREYGSASIPLRLDELPEEFMPIHNQRKANVVLLAHKRRAEALGCKGEVDGKCSVPAEAVKDNQRNRIARFFGGILGRSK
jgi:hypothetical protein